MNYPSTKLVLEALKSRLLSGASFLAGVRCCALGKYEDLLGSITDLAAFPCALVTAGNQEFPDAGATRETELAVFLIDEFRVDPESAVTGFDRVDALTELLSGDIPGSALELSGAQLTLESVSVLELPGDRLCWQFTLKSQTCIQL